jgi:hypothetical protein
MKRKSLSISEDEWKKLNDYKIKNGVPFWLIIKYIIEGKIKEKDLK